MPPTKPPYPPEFRNEAVQLARSTERWTGLLGLPGATVRTARTLRRRLLALPGRLTRTARRFTLHLPARWPWRNAFIEAPERIRALPAAA